jgi:hypothetical protein
MADFLKGVSRAGLEQGLGMGWGDEAEAWLRSKLGKESYEDALKQIHQEQGQFAEKYPIISPASEFVGGAAPLVASYLLPGGQTVAPATTTRTVSALAKLAENPYIRGAVTGATTGAVSGAGSAESGDRIAGGASGAVLGGGLGAVIPAAIRGAGGIGDYLQERINPSDEFINRRIAEKLNKSLDQSGLLPKYLDIKMAVDRSMNVPSVLANADQGLADLAETVAQRTGAGARKIEDALTRQKLGARERTYQQVSEGLSPGDYYADEQKMVDELRNKAKTLYDQAYEQGDIDDPRINQVLKHPAFKNFYDKARDIANTEALTAKLQGKDPEKYKLKDIYKFVMDENGMPISIETSEIPDVRTLDYIKRGIDASIESGFNGNGLSKTEASALRNLRKEFVNAIDENAPDYKFARSQYAGDMEVLDAMRSGMNDFNKMDHEQVANAINSMSQAEKDAFRTGVTRHLYSRIMDPSNNFNAAQRIIGSPETQQKLQPLFDSDAQFKLFKNSLERESQLFNQANKILGGSQTGKRIQMRDEFEQNPGTGEFIANAISGGFGSSLSNLAMKAIRNTEMTEKTASKMADLLMEKDPHKVAAAVKMLEDYAAKAEPTAQRLKAAEAGAIGGAMTSIYPAPALNNDNKNISMDIKSFPTIKGPDIEADIEADRQKAK